MITASFKSRNGQFYKFRVSGHSGYSYSGSDIVCAAVSAMVMLTVNTVTDGFGVPSAVNVDEEDELAGKFGVFSIPTLVVMKDGKVVEQAAGARPKAQILAMVDA